jgi:hypothetical protein
MVIVKPNVDYPPTTSHGNSQLFVSKVFMTKMISINKSGCWIFISEKHFINESQLNINNPQLLGDDDPAHSCTLRVPKNYQKDDILICRGHAKVSKLIEKIALNNFK